MIARRLVGFVDRQNYYQIFFIHIEASRDSVLNFAVGQLFRFNWIFFLIKKK